MIYNPEDEPDVVYSFFGTFSEDTFPESELEMMDMPMLEALFINQEDRESAILLERHLMKTLYDNMDLLRRTMEDIKDKPDDWPTRIKKFNLKYMTVPKRAIGLVYNKFPGCEEFGRIVRMSHEDIIKMLKDNLKDIGTEYFLLECQLNDILNNLNVIGNIMREKVTMTSEIL